MSFAVWSPLLRPVLIALIPIVLIWSVLACSEDKANLNDTQQAILELRENFIDKTRLADEHLDRAAIKGIVEYLDDPYTSYLDRDQYQDFTDSLSETGRQDYEGIGASIQQLDDQIVIVGPMPNSPASRAGIKPGDVILEIDGYDIQGQTVEKAVSLIRGPKDSNVLLTIRRVGSLVPMTISVIRDTIELTNVMARMQQNDIGYISISRFDTTTAELLREGIAGLRTQGAQGLILDLRDNGGGLLESAADVLSEFVESGVVCLRCNVGIEPDSISVTGQGTAFDLPLVVIVNSLSASASEIVAGAIQDHKRGVIIGTTTFGKGSVNLLMPLQSGAGLYITISRWETPNGRLIEGLGLLPDVAVGNGLDVAANHRIAEQAYPLCLAFEIERDNLAGQKALIKALDGVCNLSAPSDSPPQIDEALEVASVELRKILDR